MKQKATSMRLRAVLCLAAGLPVQMQLYSAQPEKGKSASAHCSVQTADIQELPVQKAVPDKNCLMLQVTPDLLAQIDGIIDETVAEALAVQREEYELQAESERRKAAAARQGIERSRNFWRNAAITSCAVLAAGIFTELLIYRRNQ